MVEPCAEFIDEFLRVAHIHGSTLVGSQLRVNAFEAAQCRYGHYLAVGRSQLVTSEDVAKEVNLQIVVILRTESVVECTPREFRLHLRTLFQSLCRIIP